MHPKIICLFISILLLTTINVIGQEINTEAETVEHQVKLNLGVDLAQAVAPLVTKGISGYGLYFDVEIKPNVLILGDVGGNTYDIDKDLYSYKSNGSYIKLGTAYNIMNHEKNQAIVGVQYAFSYFDHEMPGLFVENYWDNRYIQFTEENVYAHWIEFIGGLRVEIVKNLYLAYTLRIKLKPWTSHDSFTPLYIPGYHKNRGKSSFGISYYITYRIPLYKK